MAELHPGETSLLVSELASYALDCQGLSRSSSKYLMALLVEDELSLTLDDRSQDSRYLLPSPRSRPCCSASMLFLGSAWPG